MDEVVSKDWGVMQPGQCSPCMDGSPPLASASALLHSAKHSSTVYYTVYSAICKT